MKCLKIIVIVYALINISCVKKVQEKTICLNEIEYIFREEPFVPSRIKLDFMDKDSMIPKYTQKELLKDVFFFSIEKENRGAFLFKYYYYERKNDITSLFIGTDYFQYDKNKKWTSEEIKSFLIKDGVGLIIGKDTLKVKKCN